MKRRELLVSGAAVTAAIGLGWQSIGYSGFVAGSGPASGSGCALLPIEVRDPEMGSRSVELRISRFFPDQTGGSIARWNLDLLLADANNQLRTVYAWQLQRAHNGLVSAGPGLRMRFPDRAYIDVSTTLRTAAGANSAFSARLPNSTLMVLATARAKTGQPPAMRDLRFDPAKVDLLMADGTRRDFDALLLQTS